MVAHNRDGAILYFAVKCDNYAPRKDECFDNRCASGRRCAPIHRRLCGRIGGAVNAFDRPVLGVPDMVRGAGDLPDTLTDVVRSCSHGARVHSNEDKGSHVCEWVGDALHSVNGEFERVHRNRGLVKFLCFPRHAHDVTALAHGPMHVRTLTTDCADTRSRHTDASEHDVGGQFFCVGPLKIYAIIYPILMGGGWLRG